MAIYFVFMIAFIILSDWGISNKFTLSIATIALILVSGFRYYVGVDYGTYALIYDWLQKGLADWQIEKSPLFTWVMQIGITTGWGYQWIVFISGLVFLVGFMYFVKNCIPERYWMLSYFLLFATHLIFLSFNIFRQAFALGIVLIGFTYFIKKRNLVVVIIAQLIAFEIHSISILFLLIYICMFFIKKSKSLNFIWLIYFISLIFMVINPTDVLIKITQSIGILQSILGRYTEYLGTVHMDRNMFAILKQVIPNFLFITYLKFFVKRKTVNDYDIGITSGFVLYIIFSNIGVGIELIIRLAMLFIPFYIAGSIQTLRSLDKEFRSIFYWGFIIYGFFLVIWLVWTNGYGAGHFEWFFGKPLFQN